MNHSQGELHTLVVGLNHITAPVELRDKVHFEENQILEMAKCCLENDASNEAVIVSTCNRSEVYLSSKNPKEAIDAIYRHWARIKKLNPEEIQKHSYEWTHLDSIVHLFNVVCSLDSMIIGENQILGQVRDAYQFAVDNQMVKFYFNNLFQQAFKVGKRVRSETHLNEGAVSISYAAVELAKKVLGKNLEDKVIGVIGSGEMGELTAGHLSRCNVKKFLFFNRSVANAEKLASKYNGETRSLEELSSHLQFCDIIISATGARDVVITESHVKESAKKRGGKIQFFIDIAAPRDIDPAAGDVDDVFVFTIDDLKKVIGENVAMRQEASEQARQIIDEEVQKFETWFAQLNVSNVLQEIRGKFQSILEAELENKASKLDPQTLKQVQNFSQGLINKILHSTFTGIKQLSGNGEAKKISQFANVIFDLNLSSKTSSEGQNSD